MVSIRAARAEEFARLAEIELDAFVVWAKACGVTSEPSSAPDFVLRQSLDQAFLLVAEDATGHVAGFAAGHRLGHHLHIVEVDVETFSQGKGLGRALMLALLAEGSKAGLKHAVLTTDRFAPFNAPFYARLGFRILEGNDIPPFLRERLEMQISAGLDPDRRVAMQMDLSDEAF
ncbi:GNAT family N-acetyltransferase [Agrobacterium sp. lyk4-40-TYG-31]|uniref:GNAT family N-acetyltransferase n=1 Tax=Agrobacterium sp. lyk4-40-TYG-31 TaxID=3040276 RepID=UPI00255036CF|nr:GNAT family N-acetyltransferase [Agrobacterium sp. lyk4-40-TYG-31]